MMKRTKKKSSSWAHALSGRRARLPAPASSLRTHGCFRLVEQRGKRRPRRCLLEIGSSSATGQGKGGHTARALARGEVFDFCISREREGDRAQRKEKQQIFSVFTPRAIEGDCREKKQAPTGGTRISVLPPERGKRKRTHGRLRLVATWLSAAEFLKYKKIATAATSVLNFFA